MRETNFSSSTYQFINPLLGCEVEQPDNIKDFNVLRKRLSEEIARKKLMNELDAASVYFDTRNGKWLGINLSEKYYPASMMKVPLMIAVFKKAEKDPQFLKRSFVYHPERDLNREQNFKPMQSMVAKQSYTIEELVERLIIYSDNNTLPLFAEALAEEDFEKVNQDFGIVLPTNPTKGTEDYLSIKDYVNFFRVLYNATYLNRDLSEKALNILSQAAFKQGIVAGVPTSTVVAQKFGEQKVPSTLDGHNSLQLHDCGVVYYTKHPYMLCIMTKGSDATKLANVIKELSAITFQEVERLYP